MKRCNRTNCVCHEQNNEDNYSNGCAALARLYKDNNKCKFFKEVKNGDYKADKGRELQA